MIEVEIKVKILNPDEIREKFLKNDGVYRMSLLHEDTYFNMPKELRDFRKTDEALRIRKSISHDKYNLDSPRNEVYFMTYKGAKLDGSTKTRNEIETIVEEGEKIKEVLKILGFREVFTVKKERELYEFTFKDYHIEALIDYLPILKEHFIEVEYMVDSIDSINEARQILFDFLSLFGINEKDSIRKSYLELIAEKFKKN